MPVVQVVLLGREDVDHRTGLLARVWGLLRSDRCAQHKTRNQNPTSHECLPMKLSGPKPNKLFVIPIARYETLFASPTGRPNRSYRMGTTTMFRAVELNKPNMMTIAIGA
jgi:hypothetical protein